MAEPAAKTSCLAERLSKLQFHLQRTAASSAPSFDWQHHQTTLPRLPLPTLEETCERYVTTVESLITAEEMQGVKTCLSELLEPGSVARRMHADLEAMEKQREGTDTDATFVRSSFTFHSIYPSPPLGE